MTDRFERISNITEKSNKLKAIWLMLCCTVVVSRAHVVTKWAHIIHYLNIIYHHRHKLYSNLWWKFWWLIYVTQNLRHKLKMWCYLICIFNKFWHVFRLCHSSYQFKNLSFTYIYVKRFKKISSAKNHQTNLPHVNTINNYESCFFQI